jgi:hypothetical protein
MRSSTLTGSVIVLVKPDESQSARGLEFLGRGVARTVRKIQLDETGTDSLTPEHSGLTPLVYPSALLQDYTGDF